MAKGAYDINETKVGPTKDGSFRSMLCAMLVFVAICGIIIIVAWPWKNANAKVSSGNSIGTTDAQKGNKDEPSKKPKEQPIDKPNEHTTDNGRGKPHDNPNQSGETLTEYYSELTTNSPRKNEKIISVPVQSTTANSILTTSSYVPSSTQKIENPGIIISERNDTTQKPEHKLIEHKAALIENNGTQDKIETFTEDKTKVLTTKSPKVDENNILNTDHSTTAKSVLTTPSFVDNSTQKTEKPSKPANQTETTLITGAADLSNKSDNKSDAETTTSFPTEIKELNKNNNVTTKSSKNEETLISSITTLIPENESTTTSTIKEITKTDKDNSTTVTQTSSKDNKVTTNSSVQSRFKDTILISSITTITPENESTTLPTTLQEITKTNKDNSTIGSQTGSKDNKITTNSSEQSRIEDTTLVSSITTITPENESTTLLTTLKEITKTDKDNSTTVTQTDSKDNKVTTNSSEQSRIEDTTLVSSITTITPENESTTLLTTFKEITKTDKDNNTTVTQIDSKDNKVTTNSSVQSRIEDTTLVSSITTITPENESTTLLTTFKEITKTDKDNSTTVTQIDSKDNKVTTNSSVQSRIEDTTLVSSITTITPENESTTLLTTLKEITKTDKDNSTTVTQIDSKDNKVTTNSSVQSRIEDTTLVSSITTITPENESTTIPTITSTDKKVVVFNKATHKDRQNQTENIVETNTDTSLQPKRSLTNITTIIPENDVTTVTPPDSNEQTEKSENVETTTYNSAQILNEHSNILIVITTPIPVDESTTLPTTQKDILETDSVDQSTRSTESPTLLNQNTDECKAECRKVGARILSRMSHSADPCEQFYDYACGSDNNDNALEDNWKRIAKGLDRIQQHSPDVYKMFQKFHESCVDFHTDYNNVQRVFEAKDILSTVGQPYENSVNEDSALTDLLTRLLQLDSSPLFDISVDVDTQTKKFIFQLNIGKRFSTLLNDNSEISLKRKCINKAKKQLYFSSSSSSDYMNLNEMQEVYLNCMKNGTYKTENIEEALDLLNFYNELEPSIEHIEKIIEKYKEFASAATIRKDIITKQFVVKKVSELEFHYPLIKWKQLLTNLVGKKVDNEDFVQVYFNDFFFTLFSSKQTLTKPQLYNAILAMYINDLYANLVLPTPMENPEEFCLHQSSDLMKEVASSLYLESINQTEYEGDLKRVNDLFRKMKTKLQDMMQNDADWLNGTPRISLIKKLNKMTLDTTWDQKLLWKNMSLLQERMNSLNRTYGNYSDFNAALVQRNRQLLYNMWNTTADIENNVWWHFLTPYSTNPVSIYALNTIAIPPAMLLTSSNEIPRYLSLARLGYNLAKAVGYHFDPTGSRYQTSLDNKAQAAYKEADTCIKSINFNKELKVKHDGKNLQFKVNEESLNLTLNERFVENLAINLLSKMSNEDVTDYQISWIASNPDLVKAFSREKMFFIALGQEHCKKSRLEDYFLDVFEREQLPPSLVLDITLSHSELFKDVFNCKGGSRMNVELKCKAFPVWDAPDPDQYIDYI